MKTSTRRRVESGAATGLVLVAVGLRAGLWLVDHVEVFMPGATIRRLWHAGRAAPAPVEEPDGAV